ncbi:MAG: prepilin-type N-terminal cleavage/methylation domain-containing protein [Lachnospiraceae bacterium]|nr:prepilin-type N-terminal cleavage/methylation domain-containing protein [Lachnospiraceae bacterium]
MIFISIISYLSDFSIDIFFDPLRYIKNLHITKISVKPLSQLSKNGFTLIELTLTLMILSISQITFYLPHSRLLSISKHL